MSVPAGASSSPAATGDARLPLRWLVSPRYDIGFFVASCLVTWFFLGLYHLIGHVLGAELDGTGILLTYFFYTAVFDHPHIFQTFSRTHADSAELARHRPLHTWGLAAFVAAGFLVAAAGWEPQLIVFAAIYGSWHIIRQHWGFVRIYKALNRDFAPVDNALDWAIFYLGMAAFLAYDYTGNPRETIIFGALEAPFPNLPDAAAEVLWYAFVIALCAYAARQVWRLLRGQPLNVPKLLLMIAALSTHGLVFFFTATPFLVAEALETSYHNVQYQGFIMHYQRRRFPVRGIVRRWLLLSLTYGLIAGSVEVLGLLNRDWSWLFVPFAMAVIYHYYVDGKIWRMRQAPELRQVVMS